MSKTKILYLILISFIVLLISGFSIINRNNFSGPNLPVEYDKYEQDWEKVDSLISVGLPKSALVLVESIYDQSKAKNNAPQFIKASIYKLKLKADFEEAFIENTVADLKAEIEMAQSPTKQILHSILADVYWRYYQANRYKFLERTTTTNPDLDDIQTWDLKTLLDAVIKNYSASLDNKDLLLQANLRDYDVILETATESKKYRPTLYDFLAHRAADFFMNDESSLTEPAYRFEIDKKEYFGSIKDFVNVSWETKDSLSLKFYALEILQDLVAFHINDKDPAALIDANLKRLIFVYQNTTLENKDELYIRNLEDFEKEYNKSSASADISFHIANHYFREGNKYNPLQSDDHKWEIKKAADKCKEAISKFPESDGAINCRNLLEKIETKQIQLTIDYVNLPENPFLGLIGFKNVSHIYFRIVKISFEKNQEFEGRYRNQKETLKSYIDQNSYKAWDMELPNDGDYQLHTAEMKFPALDKGFYIVLVSTSEKFDPDDDFIAYQSFWTSNMSYISQNSSKGDYRYYTLHRENGTAVKNVKAQLFYRNYNYNTRETEFVAGGTYISDDNGYFEVAALDKGQRSNSYYIQFTSNGDTLVTNDNFYHSQYSEAKPKPRTITKFFTDRAIYRPGQTVYFKGIVLEKTGDSHDLKVHHKTTVKLYDANYQQVSELELSANEYGSFHGSFTVPSGGLNGRMTIKNESGSVSISVEEYKRPKFEVVFNPIEGSYKLNEEVSVTGKSQAFAGNNITMAEVKYRVVRETTYPWRYGYFWDWFPFQSSMEITNGFTQTDEDGNFTIKFNAIPDQQANGKYTPVFNYTIYADVTDINGETQSNTTNVRVSSVAMEIMLDVKDIEQIEDFKSLTIDAQNLNGQKIDAKGKIVISKLKEPERLTRKRNWVQPDLFLIDKESFIKDFPFDAYKDENELTALELESEIAAYDFDTRTDSVVSLALIQSFKPGKYLITAKSNDGFGEEVELKKYVILFSKESKKVPIKQFDWFYAEKDTYEPGETAKFIVGSADKNIQVMYEVVQKDNILKHAWIKLSNEQKTIEFPVLESHRGGITINVLFVKHNRAYSESYRISVPYTNKELDFEFLTFRNKLTPGQQETWSVKIKGKDGDKVAAELLASMYDMSLDKFVENSWELSLYPAYYSSLLWNARGAFSLGQAKSINPKQISYTTKVKTYDQLNWFGFNYFGNFYYRGGREGVVALEQTAMPGEMAGMKDQNISADAEMGKEVLYDEIVTTKEQVKPSGLQIRRDFKETAFFYSNLLTDENGDVEIKFTVPESLTQWKLMGLAHSKELKYGQFEKEIVTRKDLMIVPNAPRFFRHNDKMIFSAKVVNMAEQDLTGSASLQFLDTRTNQDITNLLTGDLEVVSFDVKKGLSQQLEWEISIPEDYDVISYRIIAKSGNFSDGEEKAIPVLSNRMLVTETLPMPVKGNETKKFKLKKLITSGHALQESNGHILKNHKLTLEFTSNPTWYAVQALPYLFEPTSESADAAFRRYYANSIAAFIVNSNPKIKQVFDIWKNYTPDALLSNLEKNEELKSVILNETPWVRDAQNETERKQRVAVLFDLNKIAESKSGALRKLLQMQSPNGGFPWYQGGCDNVFITQRIVLGLGHLQNLGIIDAKDGEIKQLLIKAVRYLDQSIVDDYKKLLEKEMKPDDNHIGSDKVQYLYARSYFHGDIQISKSTQEAFNFYAQQAKQYWTDFGIYQKAMIALAMQRFGEESIQFDIMKSVDEHSLISDEMGKYWRDNKGGFYWYEAPIETQALLIEAYDEVSQDKESVALMKIWLLKQKQTQDWKTPKATADAVYALLLRGSDWLANDELAIIEIGNETINPLQLEDTKVEAGTGYFKTSWSGSEINPSMGSVTVTNQNESIGWGALYWQYFQDLDKITFAKTPLAIDKKLYLQQNTDAGPVLKPIDNGTKLKVGDKVKVRIEIRVDRDMEFVHMKDMRASAFEPVNVLSGYRYAGGLGYYESTLDASTNFFFDYLRKGAYVFEYELTASQKGDFSNGITTIQCMYAPEFASHSEGVRVVVE
jgi:hypothetical protein